MSPNFEQFLTDHDHTFLLVDTCVLFDLLFADDSTLSWFKNLTDKHQVAPVGNEAILLELLKNSKSKAEYDKRADLYVKLVKSDLPLDTQAIAAAQEMAIAYGPLGRDVSVTDFLLAGSVKRYSATYLLTANHKDFPITVLERLSVFSVETGHDVRSFGVYGYSEEKFLKRLAQLGF